MGATSEDELMLRVLLFSLKTTDIKVTVEAFFDDAGNLIVEGYDIGKTVESYWGDSDYEYSVTVQPAEVARLCSLLNIPEGDHAALLSYLQAHYNTNTCYSDFRNFLTAHHIVHEGFSWN